MKELSILSADEAKALLLQISPRIGSHAGALAELCGYLPLALRVTASIIENSTLPVERYLKQLEAEHRRLEAMKDAEDVTLDVEASLRRSYDMLDLYMQITLGQLSVFAGTFDLLAAQAVVDLSTTAPVITTVLDQLYRRSLVEWNPVSARYGLHDLVREFAARHLSDPDAVYLRHAVHYVSVVSKAQELWEAGGAQSLAGLALFDEERANTNAAWRWLENQPPSSATDELLLQYASATVYIGNLRYHKRRERLPHLEAAHRASQRLGRRNVECRLLGYIGLAHISFGDDRGAIPYYEHGLAIAREIDERYGQCTTLGYLGLAYLGLGDGALALSYHQQQYDLAQTLTSPRLVSYTLNGLGLAYLALGDFAQAVDHFQRQLMLARDIGYRRSEGYALGGLGLAYVGLHDLNSAIGHHEQQLAIMREIGDRQGEAACCWNLGQLVAWQGDQERAIELTEICVQYELDIEHIDAQQDATFLEQLQQGGLITAQPVSLGLDPQAQWWKWPRRA